MAPALLTLFVAVLTGVSVIRRNAWAARGIRLGLPLPILATTQAAAALTIGLLVANRIGLAASLGAAAFTWLTVLTIATDLASRLLPREACNTVSLLGIPLLIISWSTPAEFAFGMCAVGLVILPWILRVVTRRGLGFGDIRLLTAATLTLSWWVGETLMLYGLIAACLGQILLHLITLPWRGRIGDHEPVTSARSEPSTQAIDTPNDDDRSPVTAPPRTRRMLPFGPALTLAFTSALLYAATTGMTACATWALVNACG